MDAVLLQNLLVWGSLRLVPISLVLRDFSPKIGGVFDVYLVVDTALCR